MTRPELHRLGTKLRALGMCRGEWLTYIDGTLPLLTVMPHTSVPRGGCLACDERRQKKAQAQQRWRNSKQKQPGGSNAL